MMAKLIVHGESRDQAVARVTNIPFHAALLDDPDFVQGNLTTEFIANHPDLLPRAEAWRDQQPQKLRQLSSQAGRVAAIAAAITIAQ
jgi:acetyl/propionyl-CoA carboxylase alpha subunit